MRNLQLQRRTWALLAVVVPLLALLIYVALRTGPLAPIAVTVASVESGTIRPSLFGVGTVEARYTYKIGPTFAGRVKRLDVHVGDLVKPGQVLGEMEPVDLGDRIRSQEFALRKAEASMTEAQARHAYALSQVRRYEQLFAARLTSEEVLAGKRQELQITEAAAAASREDFARMRTDREALVTQRNNLRLVAPVGGVVVTRDVDPGTTLVAGQTAVEVIDPDSLWINARFDQISASGLAAGLPARIELRSRRGAALAGSVLRAEPKADAVTEEALAKVVFAGKPSPMPAVGEIAEVTVNLPELASTPIIPNVALRRQSGKLGVWQLVGGQLSFTSIGVGASDLEGRVQVLSGLKNGDVIVLHSEKALNVGSRVKVVQSLSGGAP